MTVAEDTDSDGNASGYIVPILRCTPKGLFHPGCVKRFVPLQVSRLLLLRQVDLQGRKRHVAPTALFNLSPSLARIGHRGRLVLLSTKFVLVTSHVLHSVTTVVLCLVEPFGAHSLARALSLCLSLSVIVSLCLCLSLSLSVSVCHCLSLSLSVIVSLCLCLSLSLYLSVCLSVCLSLSLSLCAIPLFTVSKSPDLSTQAKTMSQTTSDEGDLARPRNSECDRMIQFGSQASFPGALTLPQAAFCHFLA